MPEYQFDLSNCDREPIHIPGQIQSHGFLVVVDQQMLIRFHSENINDFIPGLLPELFGNHLDLLEQLLAQKEQEPGYLTQLIKLGKAGHFEQTNPFLLSISGHFFYLILSTSAEYFMLEFEPAATAADPDLQGMIGSSISEMLADKNIKNLLDNSARQIKKIIDYDRIMIYRFAADHHGEVIAEAKNEALEPWLGLHYPASDIPKQARELYKLNLTRLIADVNSNAVKIQTESLQRPALDLTNAQLRAVSPIHIQYLKNMGVASSFSISLIYKKELWGLIACHNYSPKFINFKSRSSARLIGQIISSALEFRQDEENQKINKAFSSSLEKLTKSLQEKDTVEEALTNGNVTVLDMTDAHGVIFNYENKRTKLGVTPSDEQLDRLIIWAKEKILEPVYHTNHLSAVYPEAAAYSDVASGIFICLLSRALKEFIIWFKPEKLQTIKWAGNPNKPVAVNAEGMLHISPRHSFEVWSQTVAGRSESWKPEEISAVMRLRDEIAYAVNQKAGALRLLNEKLRKAYEELDTFSYTISHDLKNPLATIKSYTQLVRKDATINERSQTFLERIEDRTDKMNRMINEILEYSRLGRSALQIQTVEIEPMLHELIKDLTLVYENTDIEFSIGTVPELLADPMMVSQVFSNLIGNAVKYSQHSKPARVHISGEQIDTKIIYTIKDNGLGIAEDGLSGIFELFNRMDNVKEIEGSGVGLAIVKRIMDKHGGDIRAESTLGKGSTFFVSFHNGHHDNHIS